MGRSAKLRQSVIPDSYSRRLKMAYGNIGGRKAQKQSRLCQHEFVAMLKRKIAQARVFVSLIPRLNTGKKIGNSIFFNFEKHLTV